VTPLETAGLTIFILVLFVGIFSTIFGIPGTVIILINVTIYSLITGFERIGIMTIIILLMISILAEATDFLLGMSGATRFEISKRGIWVSLIGGFAGAMVMTPFLFGLGTVVGIFLGGFTGVLSVELLRQTKLRPALKAGYGAILRRVTGILVKGFCALVMIIITMTNIYS